MSITSSAFISLATKRAAASTLSFETSMPTLSALLKIMSFLPLNLLITSISSFVIVPLLLSIIQNSTLPSPSASAATSLSLLPLKEFTLSLLLYPGVSMKTSPSRFSDGISTNSFSNTDARYTFDSSPCWIASNTPVGRFTRMFFRFTPFTLTCRCALEQYRYVFTTDTGSTPVGNRSEQFVSILRNDDFPALKPPATTTCVWNVF